MTSSADTYLDPVSPRTMRGALRAARRRCPDCASASIVWSSEPGVARCMSCRARFRLPRRLRMAALSILIATLVALVAAPFILPLLAADLYDDRALFLAMAAAVLAAAIFRPLRRAMALRLP